MSLHAGDRPTHTRMGRALVAALTAAVVTAPVTMPAPAAALAPSPRERATVVTANLLEGFSDRDLRNMSELDVFVNRLMDDLPSDPDVLLLQEVRSRSANRVAELLTRRTDDRYVVAQNAGRDPFKKRNGRILKRDTAVVINNKTMVEAGRSGYIVTKYDPRRGLPEYKYNARALVKE
ncbi:MAG: hypothetical protein ACRDJ5_02105, partial [Actinomycetota bacterium]